MLYSTDNTEKQCSVQTSVENGKTKQIKDIRGVVGAFSKLSILMTYTNDGEASGFIFSRLRYIKLARLNHL